MTELEKAVLAKVLASNASPHVTSSAYDADLRPVPVTQIVPGVANVKLLDDEMFKIGWMACYQSIVEDMLMLNEDKETQKRYAR